MRQKRLMQLVQPFYLAMMGLGAASADESLLDQVSAVGRSASREEVLELLGDHWRPRVMGTWFALFHDDAAIREAVLTSLATSLGGLTSPALAAVAIKLCGSDALPSLETYAAEDIAHGFGSCGLAAAAIEHVGGTPSSCVPSEADRVAFAELLAVAQWLAGD